MAEFSRFFNSTPSDRRQYDAEEFAEVFRTFYSDGVLNGGSKLAVYKNTASLAVQVYPGMAMVRGRWYSLTSTLTLPVPAADSAFPRVDRVVLRLDLTADVRAINLKILTGTPAANPQIPALTRNNNIYELSLARYTLPANATTVPSIIDERYTGSVCGICQGEYTVDLSDFEAQLEAFFQEADSRINQSIDGLKELSGATLLDILKAVDGAGSGIDADLLDGQQGSYYRNYNNLSNKPTITSLGGQRAILYGTAAPAASQGQNGDVYIQYS